MNLSGKGQGNTDSLDHLCLLNLSEQKLGSLKSSPNYVTAVMFNWL